MDVVQISRSLQRRVPEFQERTVSLIDPALLHKPTWRFGTEPDTKNQRDSWNKGRPKLISPGVLATVNEDKIGTGPDEDSESCPELPRHDQATANIGG